MNPIDVAEILVAFFVAFAVVMVIAGQRS